MSLAQRARAMRRLRDMMATAGDLLREARGEGESYQLRLLNVTHAIRLVANDLHAQEQAAEVTRVALERAARETRAERLR